MTTCWQEGEHSDRDKPERGVGTSRPEGHPKDRDGAHPVAVNMGGLGDKRGKIVAAETATTAPAGTRAQKERESATKNLKNGIWIWTNEQTDKDS